MAAKTTIRVAITNSAAKDDSYSGSSLEWLNEDGSLHGDLNVLGNDPGSAWLWGVSSTAPTGTGYLVQESVGSTDTFNVDFHGQTYQGALTLNADGTVGFDLTSMLGVIGELAEGETVVTTFYYTARMANGTLSTAKVTIEITGENDGPTLVATAHSFQDTELYDDFSSVGGQLAGQDMDHSAVLTYGLADGESGLSPFGTLTVDADGNWNFVPDDAAINALTSTEVLTFNVFVEDEYGARAESTVTITLNGANDAAELSSATVGLTETDLAGDISTSGTLTVSDVDSDETFQAQTDTVGDHGKFSVGTDGAWTYVADSAHNEFVDGQTYTDVFTVLSADGTQTSVTVTISGTNDVPTVAAALTAAAAEGGAAFDVDLLAGASDLDDGETVTLSVANVSYAVDGGLGSATPPAGVSLSGGTLSVDPTDPAFDHLAVGATTEIVVSYEVTDAQGAAVSQSLTLTLTISGTNDAAVITGDAAGTIVEDTVPNTLNGELNSTDVDGTDDSFVPVSSPTSTTYGTYTVDTTGHWTYALDNANATVNALNTGNMLTDSFTVVTTDGATQVVNVTIQGHTDGVIVPAPFTGPGDANDHDMDLAASASLTPLTNFVQPGGLTATIHGSNSDDTIHAGNGGDTVYGHDGNDAIFGEKQADTKLYGQAGDDTISGGEDGDTLFGGSGNDIIYGMQNPETTTPADGNDTIYGGSGGDTIFGQAGDDLIIGGYGADTLTGGAGNDTFRYLSLLDTGDTLVDFNQSSNDVIDLSAIDANGAVAGDQSFLFGDTTATANGLWYSVSDATVYVDTDGDVATAELTISLLGMTGLSGAAGIDFNF